MYTVIRVVSVFVFVAAEADSNSYSFSIECRQPSFASNLLFSLIGSFGSCCAG